MTTSTQDNLQRDIVTLNRRYLLLVRQMAATNHPMLAASAPKMLRGIVEGMTLEEIDRLAEDMVTPCFQMILDDAALERAKELPSGALRKGYITNVLTTHSTN